MSAVVSVMVTNVTIHIEIMAATSKTGAPNWKTLGIAKNAPVPTLEKSTIPNIAAMIVPTAIAIKIAKRRTKGLRVILSNKITPKVANANPTLPGSPHVGAFGLPPIIHRILTGIKDKPIMVMTDPVTTGGKNLNKREKKGEIIKPTTDATITAPNTIGKLPPVVIIASIVATPANDTPCTIGSFAPKYLIPRVCKSVANPPTNKLAAISVPISAGFNPAAEPIISGTAMIPPYIVKTCCKP